MGFNTFQRMKGSGQGRGGGGAFVGFDEKDVIKELNAHSKNWKIYMMASQRRKSDALRGHH